MRRTLSPPFSGAPVSSSVFVTALRAIDWFLPAGARAPEDTRRLRFLIGAALLGVGVAALSFSAQVALGPVSPAIAMALFGVGLLALMLISGVPGIPGTLIQGWLVIAGIWLAVGRSRITEKQSVAA